MSPKHPSDDPKLLRKRVQELERELRLAREEIARLLPDPETRSSSDRGRDRAETTRRRSANDDVGFDPKQASGGTPSTS